MTFTDANPMFPYQSSEAQQQLGIPDSPEIHLAITKLAERLVPLAEGASATDAIVRIAALRTASGGVLFGHPFEEVVLRFRASIGLPFDTGRIDEIVHLAHTDWLGQAVQQLRAEGVEISTNFGKQVSRYGWRKTA